MHLHLLGVAGSFMAGVARLALSAGHRVSGSDAAYHPPFGDEVQRLDIALHHGYDADASARPADLYLIGNAISRGNPLLESILRQRRPHTSAPQWLYENILRDKTVLAVAGTHGKTTTTALLTHLLDRAGAAPGFLVGGILPGFAASARHAPASEHFVIEADEYDSAYFDKRPKFLHYRPHTAILNNLEYDHADIYPDIAAIIRQFHYLLRSVPDNGSIIARAGDSNIAAAIASGCYTPVQHFGDHSSNSSDWHWQYSDGSMTIHRSGAQCGAPFPPPLAGAANRDNTTAAIAAAASIGIDPARAGDYLADFRPPLRRLQLISDSRGIQLYDDFAHHPTAIAKTIAALAEQRAAAGADPNSRLIAVFEPRSNTMKAGIFRDQWQHTFRQADIVIAVGEQPWLKETLTGSAQTLHIVPTATAAAELITKTAAPHDAILLMTNGTFDNLAEKLKTTFSNTT